LRFLDQIGRLVEEGCLIVYAFCLMFNHFHLLCETPLSELGRWMQELLGGYASQFNLRHDRVGHLWQARYKAVLVEDGEYFLDCSRYIHLNPKRAGMVDSPDQYYWSSYCNYVGGMRSVDWVSTGRVLRHFSGSEAYRSFVDAAEQETAAAPFERATAGLILGSEAYVDKVRQMIVMAADNPDIPTIRKLRFLPSPFSPSEIRTAVDIVFRTYSATQRMRMLIYALRRHTRLTGKSISEITGKRQSTVSQAVKELEERILSSPEFAADIDRLEAALQSSLLDCAKK
ncbi:MAG TPA: transposase, partial [Acidobacteriota bacterium]